MDNIDKLTKLIENEKPDNYIEKLIENHQIEIATLTLKVNMLNAKYDLLNEKIEMYEKRNKERFESR